MTVHHHIGSDDSSSSLGELLLSQDNKSSMPLSDSDDLSPTPESRMCAPINLLHHRSPPNLVESDSLNENFPAKPNNRRKQKCKRMALDPDAPSTSNSHQNTQNRERTGTYSCSNLSRCKKSLRSSEIENKFVEVSVGKRKRGRDRSSEWGDNPKNNRHRSNQFNALRLQNSQVAQRSCDYSMDCHYSDESNISDSSSENDAGNYTCDEGREADDEQSDWFAESGPVYGVPGVNYKGTRMDSWNKEEFALSSSIQSLLKTSYDKMSMENPHQLRIRYQKLRERIWRREIRAGRRRLQDRRPGFSIISSVNDKVSKFLQDPRQSELRLKPMTENDHNQLKHLAKLYSLNLRSEDDNTTPVLTKTQFTITTRQLDTDPDNITCPGNFPGGLPIPVSDLKRRRKTPPPSQNLTEGSNDSIESVIMNTSTSCSYSRPPVPLAMWEDDHMGDCCADSLSERLADSEPDPLPSPTALGLHDCTL